MLLKTEQTTTVYTYNGWASYDAIKDHIVTTDVISK